LAIVVVGFTRAEGSKGDLLFSQDRINEQSGDLANGEDYSTRLAIFADNGKNQHRLNGTWSIN